MSPAKSPGKAPGSANVKPVPDGYPALTPYLIVSDGAAAIEFYRKAFGAKERMRLPAPNNRVGHAELVVGGSVIMLADEFPEHGALSPQTVGGSPVMLHLYLPDVDGVAAAAVAAGGTLMRPATNEFYGDRVARITDPFGHNWHIATHIEDVPPDEMERRAKAAMGGEA